MTTPPPDNRPRRNPARDDDPPTFTDEAMTAIPPEIDTFIDDAMNAIEQFVDQLIGDEPGVVLIVGFLGETHPDGVVVDGEHWPDAHSMRFGPPREFIDEPAAHDPPDRRAALEDWLNRAGEIVAESDPTDQ